MRSLFRLFAFAVCLIILASNRFAAAETSSPASVLKLPVSEIGLYRTLFRDESAALSDAQIEEILSDAELIWRKKETLPPLPGINDPLEARLVWLDGVSRLYSAALYQAASALPAEEVERFVEENRESFVRKPSATLYQIFFKAPEETASAEESVRAKVRADDALRRVQAGESFESVAADVSEAAVSRLRGGAVGTVHPDSINPQLAGIVFSMKPGEIRGPVRATHGWYLFKVTHLDTRTSYSEKEKRDQAREMLTARNFAHAKQAALDRATSAAQPRRHFVPADAYDSSTTVWLSIADGTTFPARLVFLQGTENGLAAQDWTESAWREQSQASANQILYALDAGAQGITNRGDLPQVLSLAGRLRLRNQFWRWVQQNYQPGEEELKRHFEKHREVFRPLPRFTGTILRVPVIPTTAALALSPLERHDLLEPAIVDLNRALQENSTAPLEALLPEVQKEWPSAQVRKFQNADTLGPLLEAELNKLSEGTRSPAFESQSAVYVLELQRRDQEEPDFAQMRGNVLDHWRQTTLQETSPTVRARLLNLLRNSN